MTKSSRTYLGLESMKCLSYPQTFPTTSAATAPCPVSGGSAPAAVSSRREHRQPRPVQSAAGCLSDQNCSTGQSSSLGDKPSLPFWETNWLWKSRVCRARLQGKIEKEAGMGHGREHGIKMEGEKDGKEE